MRGKTVSFAVCVFKTKSNISEKGLREFQTEMERGRGLGGEDRSRVTVNQFICACSMTYP